MHLQRENDGKKKSFILATDPFKSDNQCEPSCLKAIPGESHAHSPQSADISCSSRSGVERGSGTLRPGGAERAGAGRRDRPAQPRDSTMPSCSPANPDAEVVAVCDVDDAMFAKPVKAVEKIDRQAAADREGLPPAARRQVDRRRHDRHARPLARADDRPGLPGRQGRLRREAGQPQRRRGAADGRGRPEVQARRPARNPAPEHAPRPGGDRARPLGGTRQGRHGPRLDPSEAA